MSDTPEQTTGKNETAGLEDGFTAQLEMLSDWHIGAGYGRPGNVDSLIRRDRDELPFVPAKTLTGIWRDALERLVYALNEGHKDGDWSKWIDFLFGNQPALPGARPQVKPREARLEIKPACLPDLLRARLMGKRSKPLRDALTFIKPGVQIEDSSGTSETDYLRFEEMARAGSFLEARCRLRTDGLEINEEHYQVIAALLSASAILIERIGGKRRRGSGKCRLTIAGLDAANAIGWLENNRNAPALPKERVSNDEGKKEEALSETADARDATDRDEQKANEAWVSVPLRLNLSQPVSIAARTLGNVTETLDFIPGTYLLPHITQKLKDLLQEVGEDCHRLFATARLQVLPATIEIGGERGLPVPAAIFRHKEEGGFDKSKRVGDAEAPTVLNRFCEEEKENIQLKGYRNGYIEPLKDAKQLPSYREVPMTVITHNTVQDEWQRPTSEVGGVYSREAIDASATLRTELRLPQSLEKRLAEKEGRWWMKLAGACRLGASNKDDYGAAELEVLAKPQRASELPPFDSNKSELMIWLLSDVLLRSDSLRPATQAHELMKELEDLLNQALPENERVELRGPDNEGRAQPSCANTTQATSQTTEAESKTDQPKKELLDSLIYTRRIESWQKSWQRPRPSLIAPAAGSCIVFKLTASAAPENMRKALASIAARGIGERRGEGYGQIAFNSPLLTEELRCWQVAKENKESADQATNLPALVPIEQDHQTYEFALLIEETAWRTALRRAALRVAANKEKRYEILGLALKGDTKEFKEAYPPMSQLGSLRAALDRLESKADIHHFNEWHKHLENTSNRADKWSKKRHHTHQSALDKIYDLVTKDEAVWKALDFTLEEMPALTANGEKRLKEKLWAEAVRSLVDACIRSHKRAAEKQPGRA